MDRQQHVLQQAIERNVLEAVEKVERDIDERLKRLDNLEENDIENIRRKRLEDLKR